MHGIDFNPASVARRCHLRLVSWLWFYAWFCLSRPRWPSCQLCPGILLIEFDPALVAQSLSALYWDSWQWCIHGCKLDLVDFYRQYSHVFTDILLILVTILASLAYYCIMSVAFYVHCPWRSLILFLFAKFWHTYACCFMYSFARHGFRSRL